MHSSRNALRHSCTAHNAYSLSGALAKTFCSGWIRRQEALQQKPPSDKDSSGTFSSFESLSAQFASSQTPERSQEARRERFRHDQPYKQEDAEPEAPPEAEGNVFRKEEDKQYELLKEARNEYRAIKRELETYEPTAKNENEPTRKARSRPPPRKPISEAELRAENVVRKARNSSRYQDPSDLWFDRAEQNVRRIALYRDHRILMQWYGERANRLFREDRVKKMSRNELLKWRELFDYKPRVFPPMDPHDSNTLFDVNPRRSYPWKASGQEKLNGMEQLEVEIARFGAFMEAAPAEKQARARVVEETRQFVETVLHRKLNQTRKHKLRADLFGSETTGLATAASDLDIRVHYESGDPDSYKLPIPGAMRKLCQALDESKDYMLAVYRHGKFEIISCQHQASGIDIQIVCSPDTSASRSWIRYYLEKMPHLRNLFFVIKTALSMRGLLDVFNGGTGSYGLFWMIVAALERRSSNPPVTSAEQLRHFLDFYSSFNFNKYGLTISPTPKTFLKHDYFTQQIMNQGPRSPIRSYIAAARRRGDPIRAGQWSIGQTRPLQPYLFCLQDPADPVNDLGRKTNAIKHLQATIRQMKRIMDTNVEKVDRLGQQPNGTNLLAILVGRCHEVWEERRRKVEEYGERIAEGDSVKAADGATGVDVEAEIMRDVPEEAGEAISTAASQDA